jgi:pimeloyl-ACP methyl ester carboxylesterase
MAAAMAGQLVVSHDGLIRSGLVAAEGSAAPRLEFVMRDPPGPRIGAPILCVHGVFGGAFMFTERFMPYFAEQNRRSAAISLRGHGRSEGRDRLPGATLDAFGDDVILAMSLLTEPPVLIVQDVALAIAERLFGRHRLAGIVAIAPMRRFPGLDGDAREAGLYFPRELFGGLPGETLADKVVGGLFSDALSAERGRRYATLLAPASLPALRAVMASSVRSAALSGVPALVLHGDEDRIASRSEALRTALMHGGQFRDVPMVGHAMALDAEWRLAADAILGWLDQRTL